ncbi:hypothetical protein [Streptomyces sp. NPDC058394]|uniref:hypothetical protein n=1 Tax=Streptomyces sp. NPDC058394 TaxID=3346477 RepID=UPI003647F1DC
MIITLVGAGEGVAGMVEAVVVELDERVRERLIRTAVSRDIEADRAKVRKSSRMVSVVISIVVVGCMLNEGWSGWYQSPAGQIVLAVLGVMFAWTLSWLRRIARTKPDPRLLDPLPATHLTTGGAA